MRFRLQPWTNPWDIRSEELYEGARDRGLNLHTLEITIPMSAVLFGLTYISRRRGPPATCARMDQELSTVSAVGPSDSTTTVDREAPSLPDSKKPRVDITDISFNGHVARRWCISLVSTESYDYARALQDLPDLDEHHARIYDTIAEESTSLLASHLGPFFDAMPRNGRSPGSSLDCERRNDAQGAVRWQWSKAPGSKSLWNELRIPCSNFSIRRQYDDLKLCPSTALISCRAVETNKVLGECFSVVQSHLS